MLVMTNILQDVAAGYYNKIVQLTYRSKGPFTRGLFNGIINMSFILQLWDVVTATTYQWMTMRMLCLLI